ncbi:hypothetical protein HYFRA_00002739 [Hymenoscyphus fraxineus]|uniref:Uncharacterized protein n=1 Tax=Hymenoscyphus fraxineus TaxID=746836 RepID=A0A9N9KS18_9HELO|nr:hypothetical protein HYFRA_00002739 [Hymenoscyphus fraxineus]
MKNFGLVWSRGPYRRARVPVAHSSHLFAVGYVVPANSEYTSKYTLCRCRAPWSTSSHSQYGTQVAEAKRVKRPDLNGGRVEPFPKRIDSGTLALAPIQSHVNANSIVAVSYGCAKSKVLEISRCAGAAHSGAKWEDVKGSSLLASKASRPA